MSDSDSQSPIEARLVGPPKITPQDMELNPVDPPSEGAFQSRGAVFVMLFVVAGVFGIPLLWTNRNFSQTERIVWSIIVTIYSAAILLIGALFLIWFYRLLVGG